MDSKTPPSLIQKIDLFLGKNLIILIPACFVLGYISKKFMPNLKWTAVYMLFTIMFASTYGLRWKDFIELGTKKKLIISGLLGQILFLPFISNLLSHIFYNQGSYWTIGHLCVAASPAAISTIIWSRISEGDVALGVVLVGINVLMIPFLAPLILKVYLGKSIQVPVMTLFWKLLFSVFIPTILAVLIYEKQETDKPKTFLSAWAKLGMLYMIVLNTSVAFASVPINLEMIKVFLGMFTQVASFYLTGALMGKLLKAHDKAKITLSYFMGMKNNGVALVMALSGFPQEATFPVALAIMCQQPIASFLDRYWHKKG